MSFTYVLMSYNLTKKLDEWTYFFGQGIERTRITGDLLAH